MKLELQVRQGKKEDVYKDVVRIPRAHRGEIRSGSVCRIKIKGVTRYLIVRGTEDFDDPVFQVDDINRDKFDLRELEMVTVYIEPCPFTGGLRYILNASDPGMQTVGWISVLSFCLGLIGAAPFLGVPSPLKPSDWSGAFHYLIAHLPQPRSGVPATITAPSWNQPAPASSKVRPIRSGG
jgi:hypothetical protein